MGYQNITVCKDCAFAKYDNNIQIGCEHNRIEKFVELGARKESITTDEKTYTQICGVSCNKYVEKSFWENLPLRHTALYNHTKIKNTFIIIDDNVPDFNTTYNNLLSICHNSYYASIRPVELIYLLDNPNRFNNKEKLQLFELMKSVFKNDIEFQLILNQKENTSINNHLLNIKDKIKTQYFTVFHSNYNIPIHFNANLNHIINEDLRQFIIMSGDENQNMWTFNKQIHSLCYFIEPVKFIGEQILEEASEINDKYIQNMIISYKDYDFNAEPTVSNSSDS